MVCAIVSKIRGDSSSAQIDVSVEVGIAKVAEVGCGGVGCEDGAFDFDPVAYVAVVADGGVSTEVAVGSDGAVFSNDDISGDDDAGKDGGAFSDGDPGFVDELNCRMTGPMFHLLHEEFVEIEEVPRVFGIEAFPEFLFPVRESSTGHKK